MSWINEPGTAITEHGRAAIESSSALASTPAYYEPGDTTRNATVLSVTTGDTPDRATFYPH